MTSKKINAEKYSETVEHQGLVEPLPFKLVEWDKISSSVKLADIALDKFNENLKNSLSYEIMLNPFAGYQHIFPDSVFSELYPSKKTFNHEHERGGYLEISLNCRAILQGKEMLDRGHPINLEFLQNLHTILLENNPRGQDKRPGEIRDYVGIIHGNFLMDIVDIKNKDFNFSIKLLDENGTQKALNNLFEYIENLHACSIVDVAIIIGQFFAIHPFSDGNGRLARVLVPLLLYKAKILSYPILDFQAAIEGKRLEYLLTLGNYCIEAKVNNWVIFFLKAVWEQSNLQSTKTLQICDLYLEKKKQFQAVAKDEGLDILKVFFEKNIVTEKDFLDRSVTKNLAQLKLLLSQLEDAGLLIAINSDGFYYMLPELMNLVTGHSLFVEEDM
jgi:fido (protein-threonine AMPylation protein)